MAYHPDSQLETPGPIKTVIDRTMRKVSSTFVTIKRTDWSYLITWGLVVFLTVSTLFTGEVNILAWVATFVLFIGRAIKWLLTDGSDPLVKTVRALRRKRRRKNKI